MFLRKNLISVQIMFDPNSGLTTATAKRKPYDIDEQDDDDEHYILKKINGIQEEYDLVSDDYDSEDNDEILL